MKRIIVFLLSALFVLSCSKDSETPAPAPKPKFTITIEAGNGGSVSSSGGSYEQGSTVSVTASAASGYRFVGWSNGETSATLNIVVTGNISITANFERIAYSVEVSGAITKGSFLTGSTLTFYELNNSLSQTGKSYNTDITDDFGSFNLSVEELTEDYARVVGEGFYWNEVTNETTEEKLSLNAISEIKEDINVNILTHLEYQRVIELVKNQGKTFSEAKAQALTEVLSSLGIETTANYGTSENYNFKDGDEASRILLVASVIIQAERTTAEVTSLITRVANDLKDNGNVDDSEVKTEIAIPLAKIDLQQVASNVYERYKEQNPELTASNYLSDYLETAKSEYQEFLPDADGDGVQDDLDICPDTPEGEEADTNGCGKTQKQYRLTTTVEGSGSISEEVIQQPTASYDYGTTVRLTANPISGWEFKEWKGDITSTENPIEVTVVEEVAVTAVFVKKKFTVTTNTEGEGAVSIAPEEESYEFQSNIELTAIPSEGWVFSKWNGDIDSTDNPVSLTVNDNIEVTAIFKRKQYDLIVTVEGEGAVAEEVVTQPTQYDNGTVVKLTANPSEGWKFVAWSGDLEGSENPTNITVNTEKSVTATFEKADSDGDGVFDLVDLCPDTPEGSAVNANGCHDIIYVAENGVTIKARETAIAGDTQEIDGEIYTVVDEVMLRELVANDEDVSRVVTTKVTDMRALFADKHVFNQDISSWDVSNVISLRGTFRRAYQFNKDIGAWDVSEVEDMYELFYEAYAFNQPIGDWDVSNVSNMHLMFKRSSFNQPIGDWNVSNVITMEGMFGETPFNQNISSWNISNVTNLSGLFAGSDFNSEINNWDTGNVSNFYAVFAHTQFNQSLSNWDVGNATTMHSMFENNQTFNQDISNWDVSQVTDFVDMFNKAEAFDQDISNWCVTLIETEPTRFLQGNTVMTESKKPVWGQCGEIYLDDNGVTIKARENAVVGESYKLINDGDSYKVVDRSMLYNMVNNDEDVTKIVTTRVTDINYLFYTKYDFNQDISSWDTSNIVDMRAALQAATLFNQDISYWDTSKVTTMFGMLGGLKDFNFDISSWDVSKVTNMEQMFSGCESFNQDLSNWDVSNVKNMKYMFANTKSFNQPLSSWDVSNVTNFSNMFNRAEAFNSDISNWDTSSAIDMSSMFLRASIFNQNIGRWNVENVKNFASMFVLATSFNQDISQWNLLSATKTEAMFYGASSFNQDISSWRLPEVLIMGGMFKGASSFNQNLSNWCVPLIGDEPEDFAVNSLMEDSNYPVWGQCGEIYLDDNEVTVKARDNAVVGESYKLINGGDDYKVVDEAMLREMVAADEDVTRVVTTRVTDMSRLFLKKDDFNQDIGSWDTSKTTNFDDLFSGGYDPTIEMSFNQDISNWDTSSVISMNRTFLSCRSFNYPLNHWDTSRVVSMRDMFREARSFNQDIGSWNVSSVSDFASMFLNAHKFNKNINSWNTSSAIYMENMFWYAKEFNQPLNNWQVGNVRFFDGTFKGALKFNQPLDSWDTSGAESMIEMFQNAQDFNQSLNNWDVSSVSTMAVMFNGATAFNQPLDNWDVSNVTDTSYMFYNAQSFNQNINSWNTSSITNMKVMFAYTRFNQPLGDWDTSSVTNMEDMFLNNPSFNQDISSWDVSNVSNMTRMFNLAGSFNQDLSDWCVSNFSSIPEDFDMHANSWTLPRPIWGTCPSDHNSGGSGGSDAGSTGN